MPTSAAASPFTSAGYPIAKDLVTNTVYLLYARLPAEAGTTYEPKEIYNLLDSRGDVYLNLTGNITHLPVQHDHRRPRPSYPACARYLASPNP